MKKNFPILILLFIHCQVNSLMICVVQADIDQSKSKILVNQEIPHLKVDKEFKKTLESIVSVSWKNRQLRDGIRSLANHYAISIILDRRVNPNQLLTLDINNTTLFDFLSDVSEKSQASVTILPNTVYIGPGRSAASIRTLLFQKEEELIKPKKNKKLLREITIQWNDLDQPRKIFSNLTNRYKIPTNKIDLIPHDLWTGGTIPKTSFAEVASIILIQYDLTYEWDRSMKAIRIIPVKYPVTVKKEYRVTPGQIQKILPEFKQRKSFPEIRVVNKEAVFSGTVEQHEMFENRLKGRPVRNSDKKDELISLDRRRYTLKLKEGSAKILIDLLTKKGVKIHYDQQKLESAGINLEKKIEINLVRASIKELLESFCIPLNMQYQIKDEAIYLTPK